MSTNSPYTVSYSHLMVHLIIKNTNNYALILCTHITQHHSACTQVGKSGKRVKGSLPPSSSGPSGSQTGANAVLQMGGRAFAPSMLNDVVRTFAPRHAQIPATAGAKSSMAQVRQK